MLVEPASMAETCQGRAAGRASATTAAGAIDSIGDLLDP